MLDITTFGRSLPIRRSRIQRPILQTFGCWIAQPGHSRFLAVLVLVTTLAQPAAKSSGQTVRVATFNTSLNRCLDGRTNPCLEGGLVQALSNTTFLQARQVAEVLQRVRPDIVLLNEFNYDAAGEAADLFAANYLAVPQNTSGSAAAGAPLIYPYRYLAPVNTGVASGADLNNDGVIGDTPGQRSYGDDAFGFGEFPGRYGMLVLSNHPIDAERVRTFQQFLWRDMPGALLPDDPATPSPDDWYSPEELDLMRLSSKSHWDLPIQVEGQTVHLLASHPTPPTFDGSEDRNGRRNHDEIRLWADYVTPGGADYLVDDQGRSGGLADTASFVVVGDLNADPLKGDSYPGAIDQLLGHPRIDSTLVPTTFSGNTDTASFNLRVDYVLPSSDLTVLDTQIFRPANTDPLARLLRASDHQLVWADLQLPAVPEPGSAAMLAWGFALLAAHRQRPHARAIR